MGDLFDGKFSPITDTMGFFKCDFARAIRGFCERLEPILAEQGVFLVKREVHGTFKGAIKTLLPLTSVERRRYLFAPTRSEWILFLDNGHQGTDASSPLSYLARELSCEAVRATYSSGKHTKRYPSVIIEIFGPTRTHFLNYVRSISAAYDGRKWEFATGGEPQSFEQIEMYSRKSVRDRFTPHMLDSYLQAMGIRVCEKDFFIPGDEAAVLIEKVGPIAPAAREFELTDVQLV